MMPEKTIKWNRGYLHNLVAQEQVGMEDVTIMVLMGLGIGDRVDERKMYLALRRVRFTKG